MVKSAPPPPPPPKPPAKPTKKPLNENAPRFWPTSDRLVIKRFEAELQTEKGIIIPGTSEMAEPPRQGVVIAAGPGKKLDDGSRVPMDIKYGDIVLYAHYAGSPHQAMPKNHVVVRENDVLGVIRRATPEELENFRKWDAELEAERDKDDAEG